MSVFDETKQNVMAVFSDWIKIEDKKIPGQLKVLPKQIMTKK